jgi:hypothetical protein
MGLGLTAFTEQVSTPGEINIPMLVNDAWKEFLTRPDKYPQWEESRLAELKRSFGV